MTTMLAMLNGLEVGLIGFIFSLALAMTAFWIWALVDCARRVSAGENGLVGWLIAICFTQVIGALAYVILARRCGPNLAAVRRASAM
jgi:hypothetical protein